MESRPTPGRNFLRDCWLKLMDRFEKSDVESLAAMFAAKPLTIATACSGTDSPVFSVSALVAALRFLGHNVHDVDHIFSCERDASKRKWIQHMCKRVRIIFTDVTEIGNRTAESMVGNKYKQQHVPSVDLFMAGFSCKSVSGLNNNRLDFADAIYTEEGETGVTFAGAKDYIADKLPRIFLLENVTGLRGQLPQVEFE